MDSDEIAQAGHLNRSLPVIAICGVSDPADGTKSAADQAGWQPIAAANAAAFAMEVIAELPATRRQTRSTEHPHVLRGADAETTSKIPPGLGKLVFETRIEHPAGPMIVGFGTEDTLVVTERNATVHRWSLGEGTALKGMPGDDPLRNGVHVVVSTATPTVTIARAGYVTLVHFDDDRHRTTHVPLESKEFVVPVAGERFATYTGRRVAVRDFADGSVLWEQPCPPWPATVTVDQRGEAAAIAYGSNYFASSNKIIMAAQHDTRPRQFSFDNFPLFGAGCQLGLSPGGDLLVCASFREVVLIRPFAQEVVHRRRLGGFLDEVFPVMGSRWQRLVCTPRGEVLWLRGRRIALIRWSAAELHFLPQDGDCDDIAFDPVGSRLAVVSKAGLIRVWEWHES